MRRRGRRGRTRFANATNEYIGRYGDIARHFARGFIAAGFGLCAHGLSNSVYQESRKGIRGSYPDETRGEKLSRKEKLLGAIRANPKAVRFEDACKAAEYIGFSFHGGEGSHRVYKREGEPVILNFQNRKGLIAEYQAKQLIQMINEYGSDA